MIKNQEIAEQIFDMINTALEASEQMFIFLKDGKIAEFEQMGHELFAFVKSIRVIADDLKREENGLNLPAASQSVLASILHILKIAKDDIVKAVHKIEFELIPLVEEMRISFYYWGMVYPDADKMKQYYEKDIHLLAGNKYTKEAELRGEYKYDLSIYVIGYNKSEYTRWCLQSLYENLPKTLTYEIILLNHGSKDDTKELFESYHPDKQLDIEVNGGGCNAVLRITEGKYVVAISNDIILGPNALENMYRCIESNSEIAWVVPTTPNISNFQTIPAEYTNFEEMKQFAEKNNVSNCYRWEQRVRLCNPMEITRASFLDEIKDLYYFHSKNAMSFPDDRKSLLCRRNGYKMYLAKDAFCHHFGQITVRDEKQTLSDMAFRKGREDFIRAFEIDPWGKGFGFAPELMSLLKCDNTKPVRILGIDCGLGGNPMKIKETIRENTHNEDIFIKNITSAYRQYRDLCGVSDDVELVDCYQRIVLEQESYAYIVNEQFLTDEQELLDAFERCSKGVELKGTLILLIQKELESILMQKIDEKGCFSNVHTQDSNWANGYPGGSMWVIMNR